MKAELEAALRSRWPEIFSDLYGDPAETGLAYGLRCEDGWYPLIELVCLALQREAELRGAPQPVATTVKEKAGTLRFRIREASDGQRAILTFAEDLSTLICEDCGHMRRPGLPSCPAGHGVRPGGIADSH